MGKGHRTCEVCGIKEVWHTGNKLLFSKFPLDPNRCRQWLKAVGNEELVQLPIEKLHEQRNVCANHFGKKDFNKKGNRLKRTAIPTLNLMSLPLTDSQLAEFPQRLYKKSKESCASTTEQKENIQGVQSDLLLEAVPSTSQQSTHFVMDLSQNDLLSEAVPSTSQQPRVILMELSQNEEMHIKPPKKSSEIVGKKTTFGKQSQVKLNLTSREIKLMEQLEKSKCSLSSLRRNAKLLDKLESVVLKEIVTSALKNQKRKPKGRRWTAKNKISALAIFKRSPKAYRYLQHLMPLPSIKTLQNVLKKIPIATGVNKAVIDHLKKVAVKKAANDRICSLVFDEITLKRRLYLDVTTDKVEGYEDFGTLSERSSRLADHALVFMLQGVRAKFKQPIAFYFVKGTVSSQKLASIIKEIIYNVEETGFNILTTICDQGPTNMGALKLLKTLTPPFNNNQNYFYCNDKKVFIIFDVPHLFKSIRNNFQNYGEMSMCGNKAQWKHLVLAEEKNRNLLYLSKITPMHVQPKYRAKMKVKYAAQILSTTVSAVIKLMAQSSNDPFIVDEMMQTGTVIHELDRLFDKTNGPSCPDDVKRGIRENVSNKTDHVDAWVEYRAKLQTIVFRNSNGVKAKNVRCIDGYITSLKSFHDIWAELRTRGFHYLNLRQLNQDALENLFGLIRQHSPTNRNPTCYSFIAALKTAIISGMTAPHNRGSNCEKDFQNLLTDFHDQVFVDPNNKELSEKDIAATVSQQVGLFEPIEYTTSTNQDIPVLSIPEEFESIESDLAEMEQQPIVYVSGYIASILLKSHQCEACEKCLKIDYPGDNLVFSYIKLREWWPEKLILKYPTINLCRLVEKACQVFQNEILPCLHHLNICQLTNTIFIANCDATFIECEEHKNKIKSMIFNKLALLLIRRQCQRINQTIILEEENVADYNKKAQQ